MGEKEGSHGENGEKKKPVAASPAEKKNEEGAKNKKEDGPANVILKVDMHCEGCARKVRNAVKGLEGVVSVATDYANNKLTVLGKVDPWKIVDRVESKVRKTVVLVSPNVPKKEEKPKEEKNEEKKSEKKIEEKKPKEPVVSAVVLKIRLHCEGCIHRIRKIILKVKGVETVTIDKVKEEVTVKGTMDGKALPEYLLQKLKRSVTMVAPKDGNGGEKKKEESGGEKKKKEESGGGEKKKEEGGGGAKAAPAAEMNKMEYHGPSGIGGFNAPPTYAYYMESLHAPQYFSDENPNACSVM